MLYRELQSHQLLLTVVALVLALLIALTSVAKPEPLREAFVPATIAQASR